MNISFIMDEFPRVHDFTKKSERGREMDDFNMYAVEKFASPSERKFHRSIRSFEQNFF